MGPAISAPVLTAAFRVTAGLIAGNMFTRDPANASYRHAMRGAVGLCVRTRAVVWPVAWGGGSRIDATEFDAMKRAGSTTSGRFLRPALEPDPMAAVDPGLGPDRVGANGDARLRYFRRVASTLIAAPSIGANNMPTLTSALNRVTRIPLFRAKVRANAVIHRAPAGPAPSSRRRRA
jgi:hypothetical protein